MIIVLVASILVIVEGSITGTATLVGALSLVPPPPLPHRGGSGGGIILPPPPRIVVLVVFLCSAPIGGLSCHGCHDSCSSSSCAAAAATSVISPTISITEYVVMRGHCSLLLTTIAMPPPLHPPFPALLPILGIGNGDNNLG